MGDKPEVPGLPTCGVQKGTNMAASDKEQRQSASFADEVLLAGTNRMEILLFSLGTEEYFGINVFKVREVGVTPFITRTPNMPVGVEGLVSLRGNVVPVLALGSVLGLNASDEAKQTMMVTEYSKRTLGFLVHSVDRIVRVEWDKVRAADTHGASAHSFVSSLTQLPDGRLVSILDVESIMSQTFGDKTGRAVSSIEGGSAFNVFFVDDSAVARRRIAEVLDQMGVNHRYAVNGVEAWQRLDAIAAQATRTGAHLAAELNLILVDVEMPEMDGYVLTKKIKSDSRFKGIPVVMHSSLSSAANRNMGLNAGADAYVGKFDPEVLADTLRPMLLQARRQQ